MSKSQIPWTDFTWSLVTGCDKVSTGCKNCFAKREVDDRWSKNPKSVFYGRDFSDVRWHSEVLYQPLGWKKGRKIFLCPRGDLFHSSVPDDFIDQVFAVMALCPQHTFQILTKRPERMRDYLSADHRAAYIEGRAKRIARERGKPIPAGKILRFPLPHVWIGVSIENQATADERIPLLLQTPAAVRWISAEPLIGPVSFRWAKWHNYGARYPGCIHGHLDGIRGINGVVVGGESGPDARPMHPDWAYDLLAECREAGVPIIFKQWGEWLPISEMSDSGESFYQPPPERNPDAARRCKVLTRAVGYDGGDHWEGIDGHLSYLAFRVGIKAAGNLLDGQEWNQYPGATA